MDAPGGLAHLEQYGALGIIALALLTLVVMLVRQFVTHILESNKKLTEGLEGVATAINAMKGDVVNEIRGLHHDVAMMFNDRDASRPYRTIDDKTNPGKRGPR